MASPTTLQTSYLPASPTSTIIAEDATKCYITDFNDKVKITVVAMAAIIGVLTVALLWSCCKVPDKKNRMHQTTHTIVSKFG